MARGSCHLPLKLKTFYASIVLADSCTKIAEEPKLEYRTHSGGRPRGFVPSRRVGARRTTCTAAGRESPQDPAAARTWLAQIAAAPATLKTWFTVLGFGHVGDLGSIMHPARTGRRTAISAEDRATATARYGPR
jgi:hypothetical protein